MSGRRCKALRKLFKAGTGAVPARTFWQETLTGWRFKCSEWRRLKKEYLKGKKQGREMGE